MNVISKTHVSWAVVGPQLSFPAATCVGSCGGSISRNQTEQHQSFDALGFYAIGFYFYLSTHHMVNRRSHDVAFSSPSLFWLYLL